MSKTAYLYDPLTKVFTESIEMDERPQYTYPDMDKGAEFSDVTAPAVSDGERARWDGTKYIVEKQYPDLLNGTYTEGSEGQVWNGIEWMAG